MLLPHLCRVCNLFWAKIEFKTKVVCFSKPTHHLTFLFKNSPTWPAHPTQAPKTANLRVVHPWLGPDTPSAVHKDRDMPIVVGV